MKIIYTFYYNINISLLMRVLFVIILATIANNTISAQLIDGVYYYMNDDNASVSVNTNIYKEYSGNVIIPNSVSIDG